MENKDQMFCRKGHIKPDKQNREDDFVSIVIDDDKGTKISPMLGQQYVIDPNTNNQMLDGLSEQNFVLKQQISRLTNIIKDANIPSVLPQDLELPNSPTNGWNNSNNNTLRSWVTSLEKSSYVSEVVLETYQKKLNKILVYALICSAFTTLISGISTALLTIDDTNYLWVAFGFNIIILIVSALTTVFNGYIRINKWDEIVRSLTSFIEKVDSMLGKIKSQSMLPLPIRKDATTFIKKQNEVFTNLMSNTPRINATDYDQASNQYNEFRENEGGDFRCSMKLKSI